MGVNLFQYKTNCTDLGMVDGAAVEMLMPGKTAENIVFEVQDEGKTPYLFTGQEIVLREGTKTVARLTITGE